MTAEWHLTTLGEHVELLTGFPFKSQDFAESGVRLARGDNVKRGHFEWGENTKYWHSVTPELSRFLLLEKDVLIGMDGSRVGENWARVKSSDLPCLLVQRVARLRARDGLDQGYLWQLIANPDFVRFIKANRTGTSIPHISGPQIKTFQILLPDLPTQKAIAATLGALEAKIELAKAMITTLEETARALFQSWFIDFHPVHAKAEGRDPALPADIAALFPDSFGQDGLPEGWTNGTPIDIADVNPTTSIERDRPVSYIDMAALPQSGSRISTQASRQAGSGARFRNGDTLVARITPCLENGKTALVDCLRDGEVAWGSTEFIVLRPKDGVPSALPYLTARHESFREHMIASMSGTSGRQRVPAEAVARWSFAIASPEILARFGRAVDPMFKKITELGEQSELLSELRDTLLPELISGRLRVAEADEQVAAA